MQTSFSIVFLSLFTFILAFAAPAQANRALFTISDVTVDVTASNALTAREQAFTQAQAQAFTSLVERLSLEDDIAGTATPDPLTLSTMIRDYEVTKEQLSSVRYVGTYTFRFEEQAVQNYFSQNAITYATVESEPLLILPFYLKDGAYQLWAHDNAWKKAWDRTSGARGLVPITVPVGDLEDVQDIGDQEATNYSHEKLENLLSRYGADEAVIAIAKPDDGFSNSIGNDLAHGTLQIDLYRTDNFRPEHMRQVFVSAGSNDTHDAVFNKAVSDVKKALRKNWKERSHTTPSVTPAVAHGQSLTVHAAISSLQDWARIQMALRSVAPINDIKVKSLKPNKVILDISYAGEPSALDIALGRVNLEIRETIVPAAPAPRSAYFSNAPAPQETLIYELVSTSAAVRPSSSAITPPTNSYTQSF